MESDGPMFLEFRTSVDLVELARRLDLTISVVDFENEYEWVIANLGEDALNISRRHTVPPTEDDVHICLHRDPLGALPEALVQTLLARIAGLDIDPVYIGAFVSEPGATERTTVRRIARSSPWPGSPPGRGR